MSGIAARLELRVLRVHVQLDGGEVAEKIAEGELPFPVGPFDLVGGDEVDDVHRPLAKVRVVADELSDVVDFHRGAPAAILLPAPLHGAQKDDAVDDAGPVAAHFRVPEELANDRSAQPGAAGGRIAKIDEGVDQAGT